MSGNSGTAPGKTGEMAGDNRGGTLIMARVISYNLSEGERPGGIKVRYKIRIATGKRAKEIDARQAPSNHGGTAMVTPAQAPMTQPPP